MCKNSVHSSASSLSTGAPQLHLLWRRHRFRQTTLYFFCQSEVVEYNGKAFGLLFFAVWRFLYEDRVRVRVQFLQCLLRV